MPSFEIPTGPSLSENKLTYSTQKQKARCTPTPKCRSITYDHEKGGMTWEWTDHNEFLAWLTAEQTEKAIEFIVYQSKKSEGPIWRQWRLYVCGREYSGGKSKYQRINQWERMIPSKKMGCQCRLTIKQYLGIKTVLGKYVDEHDHPLGDSNLQFTKLSDTTKALVMEMVRIGIDSQAIVRSFF
jgi:hypothetical protein